jgi:hypothetical protein
MLSLRSPSTDVGSAFEEFYFWGLYLRGSVDMLAFASGLWALAQSVRPNSRIALPRRRARLVQGIAANIAKLVTTRTFLFDNLISDREQSIGDLYVQRPSWTSAKAR